MHRQGGAIVHPEPSQAEGAGVVQPSCASSKPFLHETKTRAGGAGVTINEQVIEGDQVRQAGRLPGGRAGL